MVDDENQLFPPSFVIRASSFVLGLSMQVFCLCELSELAPYADDWDRLSAGVPFRSWAWLSAWWRHYGPDSGGNARRARLFVLCVFDRSDRLLGLAPWYLDCCGPQGRVLRLGSPRYHRLSLAPRRYRPFPQMRRGGLYPRDGKPHRYGRSPQLAPSTLTPTCGRCRFDGSLPVTQRLHASPLPGGPTRGPRGRFWRSYTRSCYAGRKST